MEAALDEIKAKCAVQIQQMAECIQENPEHWETQCQMYHSEVQECVSKNSEKVMKIQRECRSDIDAYEFCVKQNSSNPQKCMEQLKSLYECSKRVQNN
ncbi:hypothetical protein MIR68_006217 [Amoeboaphelidium protococcarum]|nr:hypothetical protein MIR68_006217 [Amoeboaphelidium protococcarum]KAI3645863.1 hypothetical protein MP228_008791 [Amoeboaphelidium protococcarum]